MPLAVKPRSRGLTRAGTRSLFQSVQTVGPTHPKSQWVEGVKRSEREADHSL